MQEKNDKMQINVNALRSLHRFGDIYEEAIAGVCSDTVEMTADRTSQDCIGRHWYGMRCRMLCKKTGQQFYLHTGFIFLPETRTGLMVEVDERNNRIPYTQVWNNIQQGVLYEVNRDEPVYLKLFMPDVTFEAMQGMGHKAQIEILRSYITACGEAIAAAAYTEGFSLGYAQLADTLSLACAFKTALEAENSTEYSVKVNVEDADNFGQYASGYRYWLQDKKGTNRLYAYFGAIYSYKKEPSGVFAEIDWLNNQSVFEKAFQNIESRDTFVLSKKEPKFIKLFMSDACVEKLNAADSAAQGKIMQDFLTQCNTAMILAAR
ncbi:MAG: hypothetical protein RSD27_08920 [Ruthenibacterium sp.]